MAWLVNKQLAVRGNAWWRMFIIAEAQSKVVKLCSTVEPLFYDHPQNHIGVVVKAGWSFMRGLT